jgi:phage gp29-like protein
MAEKINRREVQKQIIDIGMFRSFVSAIDDNTADWLSSVGETAKIFSDMTDDARIESLVENRKNRVLWLDAYQADGENPRLNDGCRAAIDYNKQQKICRQLLNAIPEGIAVSEVIWEQKSGLIVPVDFLPIPRSFISFPLSGMEWRTPVYTPTGKKLDAPRKFLVHRNDRGKGNPWGRPALRAAYWPWKFKKLGFRFWIMAAERIGVPSILAIFEAKTDEEVKKRAGVLAKLLGTIKSGSSAALGNVKDVKYLDAAGAIKDFDLIINTCNTEIAYAITGQSLVTNQAEYGTKAQGELHERSFDALVFGDAQALQASVQKLYDWFAEINFPGEEPLRFEIDAGEKASWKVITEAIDRGVPVSKKALYGNHRIPEPSDKEDGFVRPAGLAMPAAAGEDFADRESFFFRTPRKKQKPGT